MPVGKMDKQTLVHPYNGILLSNTEEQTTDEYKTMDGLGWSHCDSIYRTLMKRQDYRLRADQWLPGAAAGGQGLTIQGSTG